ncbi:MAG: LCP family protein [Clostridia bacterium]|nr:LCP family protein [Clostridia bacterium]
MKNRNLFSGNKTKSSSFKYFIISFSAFIVILAICSVFLFMKSLDYDISNLVDSSTTTTNLSEESTTELYSVNEISGKSNILFIVENGEGVDFVCTVLTDFDKKTMIVKSIDGSEDFKYKNKTLKLSSIYNMDYQLGVTTALVENFGISIDKYIIFNQKQFEDVLSLFDGFSINVQEDVNFKSHDFNLNLSKGIQELSPDLAYKYLRISNRPVREKIVCDIIKSILVVDYIENSDYLFKQFVNLCKTDISVIDYSESIDKLKTYCYAQDKFFPTAFDEGDK